MEEKDLGSVLYDRFASFGFFTLRSHLKASGVSELEQTAAFD